MIKKIIIISIIIIGFFLIQSSQYYGTMFPKNPADFSNAFCSKNDECTLAIFTDNCCTCPFATNKKVVAETKNLHTFVLGESRGDLYPQVCSSVDCAQCPPATEVKCKANICELVGN